MKKILGYLAAYWQQTDKRLFAIATVFIAIAIFVNYYNGLNNRIAVLAPLPEFGAWSLLFLVIFGSGYLALKLLQPGRKFPPAFWILLLLAPAIFAWKMVMPVDVFFTEQETINAYWNRVLYWPLKLVVITSILWMIWKLSKHPENFYGLQVRGFRPSPYLLMLLIMLPLVAAASTQPDFLNTYPKLKQVSGIGENGIQGWQVLLYELSYGSDFFTIELFFRGFLVLAFSKWFGKDAILPMAMFYCSIHFGKPIGECISSFFGGLILGVVTYHTRSIYGGLLVHLGIAWLMELGGYLGNLTR